jgi:hypothetical protein
MSEDEYTYFKEYQDRVFDLIENLREMSSATIPLVFDYLSGINATLPDIIIMLWCLPRSDQFLSKINYNKRYKENIAKYNRKLIRNIEHRVVADFCLETLTKTNNVPVHCIDYLWFYMNKISMEFIFYNSESGGYIGITILEDEEDKNSDEQWIELGLNVEYILGLGLGRTIYKTNPSNKGTFQKFLFKIFSDPLVVEKLVKMPNFCRQMLTMSENPSKYFGSDVTNFSPEIIAIIEGK